MAGPEASADSGVPQLWALETEVPPAQAVQQAMAAARASSPPLPRLEPPTLTQELNPRPQPQAQPQPQAHLRPHQRPLPQPQPLPPPLPQPAPPVRQHTPAHAPRKLRSVAVLALQARAFKHARYAPAATAVANELARQLGCDRVSIGFVHNGRVVVGAMANTADIGQRQATVRAIADAMDEAVDQRDGVVFPLPPGLGTSVCQAHAALADLNGQQAICTVPIVGPGGPSSSALAIGALLLERAAPFDLAALETARDAATFVGPVLALKHRLDQPVSGRIADAVAPPHGLRQRWGRQRLLAAGAAAVLAALLLWPSTFRVLAPVRLEGLGQQLLAAPFDGFVGSAPLRPGADIRAGQLLLTLEDRDLQLEQDKWEAELGQLDKKYREAHSSDDAAQIVLARSKLAQAQAQLDLVQRQRSRAQLLAPFDGVLLAGDHSQAVGAPVQRGQVLLTVAPSRGLRVVAEVDEQDVAQLRSGQSAQLLFAALDGSPLTMQVTRIAPLASVVDGRNVFEVDGQLQASHPGLRPGLRGVARIDIAPRLQGWIWWHRASQWLRGLWWRLTG